MTCIVGYCKGENVYLGGDSGGFDERGVIVYATTPKVWIWEDIVFGGCGAWRGIQVLQQHLTDKGVAHQLTRFENDLEQFMVKYLLPEIKSVFERHASGSSDYEGTLGSTFLIGTKGKLYYLENDFSFFGISDKFGAVGSGDQIAIGALSILSKSEDLSPKEILHGALESAERYNSFVRRPFKFIGTGNLTQSPQPAILTRKPTSAKKAKKRPKKSPAKKKRK